jgi:hypothetical protein
VLAALLVCIGFLVLMAGTIYVEVRISLAFPLTFVRRNFIIGEAWRLSRGRFWTLFGAYFLIVLIHVALATLLFAFAFAPFFSELAQGGDAPEAVQLAVQHQFARFATIDATNAGLLLGAALLCGLGIALFGGAVATAARDLLAGDPALSEAPAQEG